MRSNPYAFRERFKRWKDGERYWSIIGQPLPHYQDGKDEDDPPRRPMRPRPKPHRAGEQPVYTQEEQQQLDEYNQWLEQQRLQLALQVLRKAEANALGAARLNRAANVITDLTQQSVQTALDVGLDIGKRNSLLPPPNTMGRKNPLLGVAAHEANHAFNDYHVFPNRRLSIPGTYMDQESGRMASVGYYIPNPKYYLPTQILNFRSAVKTGQINNPWTGSPEEVQGELYNWLGLRGLYFNQLSPKQKKFVISKTRILI